MREFDPQGARLAIQKSLFALQKKQFVEARRLTMEAIQLDPNFEDAWLILAALSNPQASVAYLQRALEINPTSQRAAKGMQWALDRLSKSTDHKNLLAQKSTPVSQPPPVEKAQTNPPAAPQSPPPLPQKPREKRKVRSFSRFFSRWQNWIGLLLIVFFVTVAIAAPVLSPQDPNNPGTVKVIGSPRDFVPHSPSLEAPLGTLSKQISVYHSLVWGTRSAIVFGLVVVIIALLIGSLVGMTSGYFGGFLNNFLMRVSDSFLAFPMIAGVVLVNQLMQIFLFNAGVRFSPLYSYGVVVPGTVQVMDPGHVPYWLSLLQKIDPVMIAFILFSWMPFARVMNTIVSRIKNSDYILAARALGVRPSRIIFRHLLPNSLAPVIVLAARDVGGMVLLQATFTFIGLGGNSPWGMLLVKGRDWIISPGGILTYWWVFLPATFALILFGIGWNLLGDGLNDALNPREA
ncbi:MAG: ABC transporter permease subunit [Anaerolineaceae bacterium]